ncbi:MAG: hypothetical protein P9L99_04740 [Candidatus Lernaella stagnicola]|nr:hypothetical protein [Candidatus Lernaella stagnicola]
MKNKIVWLAALFISLSAVTALAGGGIFGLGLVAGSPTGITAKIFLSDSNALDFDAAWDFYHGGFGATGDYLFHFRDVAGAKAFALRPYIGGGGAFGLRREHPQDHDDDIRTGLAARATGGLAMRFREVPVELSLDLSPGVWIIPTTDLYLGGTLGCKYFF